MSDVATQTRALVAADTVGATEADLALINENTLKPLAPGDVFIFTAIPSNDLVDSYYTQMALSSLENYERDLKEGRALMNSHRRLDTLPLGYSFDGELNRSAMTLAGRYYMQRGLNLGTVNTDEVVRAVEGGTCRDVSIGFKAGWYKCKICGNDLMDYEKCSHVPGVRYDKVLCTAWVEDGYLAETSLVFDGATPGALVTKAQHMVDCRMLEPGDRARLEDVLQTRFNLPAAYGVGVDLADRKERSHLDRQWAETDLMWTFTVRETGEFHPDTTRAMAPDEGVTALFGKLRADTGKIEDKALKLQAMLFKREQFETLDAARSWLDERQEWFTSAKEGGASMDGEDKDRSTEEPQDAPTDETPTDAPTDEGDGTGENDSGPTLDEVDALVASYEEASGEHYTAPGDRDLMGALEGRDVDTLVRDAKAGAAFLGDLVEETVKERVRAQGDKFDADKYREMLLKSGDVDFIRSELAAHGVEKSQVLTAGRVTPAEDPEGTPPEVRESAAERDARIEKASAANVEMLKKRK